jgi:hypothetical protein
MKKRSVRTKFKNFGDFPMDFTDSNGHNYNKNNDM